MKKNSIQTMETFMQVQDSDLNKQGTTIMPVKKQVHALKRETVLADQANKFTKPDDSVIKIGIEGNIAAGKSTFLRVLAKQMDFYVVQEPVAKWQKVESDEPDKAAVDTDDCKDLEGEEVETQSGGNLLDLFYNDPKRWTYTFQSYAFLSRMRAQMTPIQIMTERAHDNLKTPRNVKRHRATGVKMMGPAAKKRRLEAERGDENTQNKPGIPTPPETPKHDRDGFAMPAPPKTKEDKREFITQFFERSVYSDRYCFASLCHKMGNMSGLEYSIYKDWHTWMCTLFPTLKLHGMIYLRSDPKVCKHRLGKRGRDEEVDTVGLDYLTSLHEAHESWLIRKEHKDPVARTVANLPMLIIDVNDDFEHNPAMQAKHIARIREFMDNIKKSL